MPEVPSLPPQVVAALQRHLGDRGDPAKAREAAWQLAGQNQWLAAAGIMRHVLTLGPVSMEDLTSYANCLVSGGDFEGARRLVQDVAGQQEAVRKLARVFYGAAALAFAKGRQTEAESIADLFLPHEPYGRRILGLEMPADDVARPSAMEDAVVADFILQAIADSAAGRLVPPGKGAARAAYEEAFAPHRNRRVLIIHRDHYYPRKDSDRTPGPDYFLESAIEAGLDARVIRSDFACAIPAAADRPAATAEEAEIRAMIETWQPEVVVYDAFGGAGRESMTECIRDLRRHQKFQVVGLFHDVWSDAIRETISRAEGDIDAVWFFDPVATSPQLQGVVRSVSTVPPIPERPFREARQRTTPTRDLGFMGSISISNHIRGLWLMEMRRRGIPIDVVTGFPFSPEAYRTIDGFAGFLASCKVSLCICGRNSEEAAIPARIWEGIFARSVLLEDDTHHMRYFLTPFAHYVPFRTIDELSFYANFLARRGDIREAIATHALEFVREAYPAVRIWHAVLETAAKARQP
jgi:hypothetical protein